MEEQRGTGLDGRPPQRLSEFIGQTRKRENLVVFIAAARNRGEALDHVLLSGPSGIGKTTLARIIASEMGGELKTTTPNEIRSPGDLAGKLTNLQPRDCLLIEDVHRLNLAVYGILRRAMDYRLEITIGAGTMERTIKVDLPPFTLIGETTRPESLSDGFRARFGIQFRLEPYDLESMVSILGRLAGVAGAPILPEALYEIAKCSGGNPGIAKALLPRLRDFAQIAGKDTIDRATAREVLARLVDEKDRVTSSDRERIPDDVRIFVWRRDQGRCVRCGTQSRLEFDHIIPIAEGGSSTERNIQLLCESCNRSKGALI